MIQVNKKDNLLEITIKGRFDAGLYKAFREAIDQAEGLTKAFVDLSDVEYMDSSALGMLLLLKEKLIDGEYNVELLGANPTVRKILEVANFQLLFAIR
jgi:anti-anti-sigma factor